MTAWRTWLPLLQGDPILRGEKGTGPVVMAFPQSGRGLPPALAARMTPQALRLPDTCWHLDELWRPLALPGTGWVMPAFSRLVTDLNRQPDPPAVPIANSTPLCAIETFGGDVVYRGVWRPIPPKSLTGWENTGSPSTIVWRPTSRKPGGVPAALFCSTPIPSAPQKTRFAGGTPPAVAVKTGGWTLCTPVVHRAVGAVVARYRGLGATLDYPSKGGFIVHRHARPSEAISAFQIEVRQDLYMDPRRPETPVSPSVGLRSFIADLWESLALCCA